MGLVCGAASGAEWEAAAGVSASAWDQVSAEGSGLASGPA